MKRLVIFILCGVLAGVARGGEAAPETSAAAAAAPASADDTSAVSAAPAPAPGAFVPPAVPLEVLPGRQGYAVDQPEVLARQRVFGLAHGVSLLAAACLDLPEQSGAVQDAYAAWHARQAAAIETVVHDLARYYFGARAGEAQWPDLARALNLKDSIMPSLGQFTLEVACATLPRVLDKPRYDLVKLLAEPAAFDTPAVSSPSPAPTNPAAEPAVTPITPPAAVSPAHPAESTLEAPILEEKPATNE